LYFIFFPTSVFFSSMYPEALFLSLLMASFYCLRTGRFLLGASLGGAACLCRINGIILLVPFAVEYYLRWKLRLRRELLSFLLIPLGIAVYSVFLYFRFGEPLAFLRVQSAQGWHGTIPVFPFFRSLDNVISFFPSQRANVWRFLEIAYSLGALGLAVFTLKRLPLSYGLYAIVACLVPLASDTWSMQRYVLGAFPIFMTLGLLSRDDKKAFLLLALFAFMLGIGTVMWTNGLWLG
jgi:Gpi18-like mannosyltransferase